MLKAQLYSPPKKARTGRKLARIEQTSGREGRYILLPGGGTWAYRPKLGCRAEEPGPIVPNWVAEHGIRILYIDALGNAAEAP